MLYVPRAGGCLVSVELRSKPGTMCAEVWVDNQLLGEVEFMNYEPVSEGKGAAWRWRHKDEWGNADTQAEAIASVLALAERERLA